MFQRFLLLSVLVFLFSCNEKATEKATDKKDDMSQFTDDKDFKDAHEKPETIAFKGIGTMEIFTSSDGKTGSAYAIPAKEATNKNLFVIHEWWGLNDQIKQEAERLHKELGDVNVYALDLYDGKVTGDAEIAGKLMGEVSEQRCNSIINGALAKYVSDDGKVATIGWCFGGGWSLRSSILAGEKGAGCVVYYGMPVKNAKELAPLRADILGIFAAKEQWINRDVVGEFEKLVKATGKNFDPHWFEADHAFANPSSPRYNETEAQKANAMALEFLQDKL